MTAMMAAAASMLLCLRRIPPNENGRGRDACQGASGL
jgi:hypothetical protein